ncbi:protein of unknown function [Burkholderia multivorans]
MHQVVNSLYRYGFTAFVTWMQWLAFPWERQCEAETSHYPKANPARDSEAACA